MRRIQKISIVGGTVGVLMAGGIAYAAWTSEGSGSGTATAGTASGLTVHVTAATDLKPTETKTMDITVDNGNTYAVNLDSLTYNAADSSVSGGLGPNCSVADLSNVDSLPTITDRIAGSGTSVAHTVSVTMDDNANNDCQGAVFHLSFDASAHSVD
jgi:predicted transcriptional regulator